MPIRRRFTTSMAVTAELLRGADHGKHDLWQWAAPWDAVKGSVVVERLYIPTSPDRVSPLHDVIGVVVVGSAEQRDDIQERS